MRALPLPWERDRACLAGAGGAEGVGDAGAVIAGWLGSVGDGDAMAKWMATGAGAIGREDSWVARPREKPHVALTTSARPAHSAL